MKFTPFVAVVCLLSVLAAPAAAQPTNLRKWRDRLLYRYHYMQLEPDRLPRQVFSPEHDNVRRRYFCFTYKITNNGEKPFLLRPVFDLRTDTGKTYTEVSREDVLQRIRTLNEQEYFSTPELIQHLREEEGNDGRPLLAPGKSICGVAIFPTIDPAADFLEIYAFGLTDSFKIETRDDQRTPFVEARVITYFRPGDRFHPDRHLSLYSQDWVYVHVDLTELRHGVLPKEW